MGNLLAVLIVLVGILLIVLLGVEQQRYRAEQDAFVSRCIITHSTLSDPTAYCQALWNTQPEE